MRLSAEGSRTESQFHKVTQPETNSPAGSFAPGLYPGKPVLWVFAKGPARNGLEVTAPTYQPQIIGNTLMLRPQWSITHW